MVSISTTNIKVDGHAGYAEPGKDIICSAVSVLTFNLIKSIESFLTNRAKIVYYSTNIWRNIRRNNGGIKIMIFHPDTPNLDKKLQEIEDNELRDIMKKQDYSEKEIEATIRKVHLRAAITRLEDILCAPDEIIEILSEEGWEKEEIERCLKNRNN